MTTIRVYVPLFGTLTADRALVLALRRLEASGELPAWPLYLPYNLDAPTFTRRASLRGTFRKDR